MKAVATLAVVVLIGTAIAVLALSDDDPTAEPGVVRTANPAVAFAPLIHLHAKEKSFPISARAFIESSYFEWSEPACTDDMVAAGQRANLRLPEPEPQLEERRLGGKPPYRHAVADVNCRPRGRSYTTLDRTAPFDKRGRPTTLPLDAGFYMNLMTPAYPGQAPDRRGEQAVLRGVPVYVERRDEEVSGKLGQRLIYWMLYPRNEPGGKSAGESPLTYEADWERVSVLLQLGRHDGRYLPVSVRLESANEIRDVAWEDVALEDVTHPVLFNEHGSHTSRSDPDGDTAKACAACAQWETWRLVRELPAEPWYGYGGGWGHWDRDVTGRGRRAPTWFSSTPEAAAAGPEDDRLIVSIGDSVASGEGNPDVSSRPGQPVQWLLRRCHRSLRSGHAQAAARAAEADPAVTVTFVPLACSGATVPEGLTGPYDGAERDGVSEPAQVDRVNELARRREIDALLLSIGANDLHFAEIVHFCLAVPRCASKRFDPEEPGREAATGTQTLAEVIRDELRKLKGGYAAFNRRLSKRIARDRVVIAEYLDPTVGAGSGDCHMRLVDFIGGDLGEVTRAEARWTRENVVQPLNAAVRAAADRHGWRLVEGVDEAYAGHGICVEPDSERWVRTLPESLVLQGLNHRGTLHPNARGHLATARLIEPVLRELLLTPSR